MKSFFLLLVLFCLPAIAHSQNLAIDIQKDWYAAVPNMDVEMLDTLRLYPTRPAAEKTTTIFVWQFMYKDIYQLIVFDNSQPGFTDPIYNAPEKWIIKETKEGRELLMKDTKRQKWFHSTLHNYRLIESRDNYFILKSIILVRK